MGRTRMQYPSLRAYLQENPTALAKGPIAVVLVEDDVEIDTTLRHHLQFGFMRTLVFMPPTFDLPRDLEEVVVRIDYDMAQENALENAINPVIAAAQDQWIYYCYNAEYFFYPFCETRSVGEMIGFQVEERRTAFLSYTVDLYADDLDAFPDAVSLDHAHLDRSGYYALGRPDTSEDGFKERQLDFFGGLRWRYEEHVPANRRKIDRIALFKAAPGLKVRPDHTLSIEEYNTYACKWHHNITTTICSFRTAKALKMNPGSRYDIETFKWHNSALFEWHSRQLLDLGLMEPGQWF